MKFWDKVAISIRATGKALLAFCGVYVGFMTPDLDISWWGIGSHRNWLTHSALLPGLLTAGRRYTSNRTSSNGLGEELTKYWAAFNAGVGIGSFVHLGWDATIQGTKAVMFPITNSLINGTILDDNLYLGGNAIGSLALAYSEANYSTDGWVGRKFGKLINRLTNSIKSEFKALIS